MSNQLPLEQSINRFPPNSRIQKEYHQLCKLNDDLKKELDQQVLFCGSLKETITQQEQQITKMNTKFSLLVKRVQELNDILSFISKI